MKRIKLTKGFEAIVDDQDYALVTSYGEWHVQIKPNGKKYAIGLSYNSEGKPSTRRMHRVILGAKKGQIVDHINSDGLDNRRKNLRITDDVGNCRNRRTTSNRSGYKGVNLLYRRKDGGEKWAARICRGNRVVETIGYFSSAESAARAYDEAAKEYFGEFASFNFERNHL